MELIREFISYERIEILLLILDITECILNFGSKSLASNNKNIFAHKLEALGAVRYLEALQEHPSEEIYLQVLNILETYYETQEITKIDEEK